MIKIQNFKRFGYSNLFFYLLILFLPTQLGKHFFPYFSFVSGIRIDYLSPTLYVTDVLIILMFISSVAKFQILNSKFPMLIFALCLIVGTFLSKSPIVGVYGLLKLLEFIFVGFYTAHNINKLKFENILLMFSIGIIFESLLSIAQYFNHGSLQGIFYWFGERFYNSNTVGIANASLSGTLILRPYGTFSHPNALAGYLTIAMAIVIANLKSQISNLRRILYYFVLGIGTIALFLTLSRVAILIWLVVIVSYFVVHCFYKLKNKHSIFHILLFIPVLILVSWLFFKSPLHARFAEIKLTDESIVQRENLINSSIAMIKDYPLFGVGLNNFLVNLPQYQTRRSPPFYLQPVHNIFLLIFAETGAAGFLFFTWFFIKTIRQMNRRKELRILFIVLTLGMFDHYFLSLQQEQLLLSFVLGICWIRRI